MNVGGRVAKNSMYLYIKTGVTVLIVLYTTRLILRSLGEVDFGIFNIVGGVISMLGFLNSTMAVTIQRFLNYEQGKGNISKQKTIFNVGVFIHIIIAIVMGVVMIVMGIFLFNGIINIPLERVFAAQVTYGALVVSTIVTILTVPYDACLNAHENFLYYSVVGIIEAVLRFIAAICVVYCNKDKLILYAMLMAIIPILSMAMMRIYCRLNYAECRIALRKYYDKLVARELFSFAGWTLLGASSNYVGNYGNMIVMNHYFGAVLNTVMGIANQVQGQLMVLATGMLRALNPVIAKEAGAGNTTKMMQMTMKSCSYAYFLLSIFAIPMLVETEYLLDCWLEDYPYMTILFVRLQLIRALLEQLTSTLGKALEAKGKIRTYNIISFAFNLLPIPILCLLYYTGSPPYYHYVVAIPFMVVFPTLAKLILCHKFCGLEYRAYWGSVLLPSVLPSICVVLFSYLLVICFDVGFWRLVTILVFSTLCHITIVFWHRRC